jgi:cytochrome c-type biogenesis protein CcmE
MSPHAKLGLGAAIVACATCYLAFLGASTSWQYYVHVDECVQERSQFIGRRIRVSGRVAANSLKIHDNRRRAEFVLRGEKSSLEVSCKGLLPDNLAEDIDVVVEGTLDQAGHLHGDKVLTRCASKYQAEQVPPKAHSGMPEEGPG